jgi:uncharacterized RDD family membrane protein YckC
LTGSRTDPNAGYHRGMAPRSVFRRAVCFAILFLLATGDAAGADDDRLPGASSDEHLWFVVNGVDEEGHRAIELQHHALAMDGPYATTLKTLPRLPIAMAAWENDLWLVFEPTDAAQQVRREVYHVEARRSPVMGGYYAEPQDRLELLPTMPGVGRLIGMVGSARGPIALIVPEGGTSSTERSDEGPPAGPKVDEPTIIQLRGTRWEPIEPPTEVDLAGARHLAAAGEAGDLLMILVGPDDTGAGELTVCLWEPGGRWRVETVEQKVGPIRGLTRIGAQVVATLAGKGTTCRLAVLRPTLLAALASFDRPDGRWTVLGLRDGARIIAQNGDAAATVRRVSFPEGEVGKKEAFRRQPTDTMNWLRVVVMLAVAIFGLVLVAVLKPTSPAPVKLPPNSAAASATGRLGALAIDMLPAIVLTYLVLKVPPLTLLVNLPLVTPTFEDSVPYIVMACLTMAHSLPTEVITRRTLGKSLLGLRVAAAEGGDPSAIRLLVRNVMKWIIVLVPPLAVIALVNPNLQGLQDLLGRTVVIRLTDESSDTPSDDR